MFARFDLGTTFCALGAVALVGGAAFAAGKATPPDLSMSAFKSLVQRSLGAEGRAFGSGDITPGQIHGKSGYFFKFKNATVGMIGKGSPRFATEKTDAARSLTAAEMIEGDSCKLDSSDNVTASTVDKVHLTATSSTCTNNGKEIYEGFVKLVDDRSSADYLIWVYGSNVSAAQARTVRDRILEQLKKDYAS
jgi:hypothetical protein